MSKVQRFKLTLVRSTAGCLPVHKVTVASLGLRKLHQAVEVDNNLAILGKIKQVGYLLKIEELN